MTVRRLGFVACLLACLVLACGGEKRSAGAANEGGTGGAGGTGGGGGVEPEPFCGDGRVDEGEECDDGNELDGDGCSPDCLSSCGDLEILPGVENCEDGNRVAGDGCSPACRLERNTCSRGEVRDLTAHRAGLSWFRAAGTTVGAEDVATPSCGDAAGGEAVFGLFVEERSHVELATVELGAGIDTILSVRRGDCTDPATELACDDDEGGAPASRVVLAEVEAATQLYVFVDTKRGAGTFVLDAKVRPIAGEGESCGRGGGPRCVDGLDCIDGVCGPIVCGDGTVSPGEDCEAALDPRCLEGCRLPVCGDGVAEGHEACDDGNAVETDGCTTTCEIPSCGDGVRTPDEECDDGSPEDDGDGCVACRLGCRGDVRGWRALPAADSCLLVRSTGRMDFWNGGYSCYAIGGYPVTVNDAAENEVVRLLAGEQNAWIGLHDGREEGHFEWMVGSSDYTNWSEGEPNNYNDREDCVEITPDGLWNDNYCGARRRVVCELPLE